MNNVRINYTFLEIILREFRAICGNRSVMLVCIVGSLLYAVLYPTPYYTDVVRKQRIAVIDSDNTILSNDFVFAVGASPNIDIAYKINSPKEAKELLERNEIYGILHIPNGFEANAKKGVPTQMLYRANASYFLIYGTIIEGLNEVGTAFSNEIAKKMKIARKEINLAKDSTLIRLNSIPLFNDSIGYINYALAAILVFILHQTLIAGSMIITAMQNKDNKNGVKAYFNQCSPIKLICARIFVFTIIYTFLFLLYFGFFFSIYGIHTHANILEFWCFSFAFIVCCAAFGIALGTFISNPALPTQIVLLSSLPLVFMMGFIYPLHLLPEVLQVFVKFIPAYHGINGFIWLNQMAASFKDIMPHFYALVAIFAFCYLIAYKRLSSKYILH